MTNPYAPPRAAVEDIASPSEQMMPADRGTRLGAQILDGLIFGVMVYLPFVVAAGVTGAFTVPVNPNPEDLSSFFGPTFGIAILVGCIGLAVWGWLTYTYVKRNGQTMAKKLLNIKVVRSSGESASVGRIFWLRNILNGFISLVPLYGLIDALFIFSESRQCLHDKLADTIVIKA